MQEGKAEILDCTTCEYPASRCVTCPVTTGEYPEHDPQVEHYLNLWRRCKRYQALPGPGGVEDQEERLMRIMDAISDRADEREALHQEEQRKKQESEAKRRR